jgi:hypothetical protein
LAVLDIPLLLLLGMVASPNRKNDVGHMVSRCSLRLRRFSATLPLVGPKPFWYFMTYFPIALVTSLVLTAAKEDGAANIARKGLKTFAMLSLAIIGGAILVWFVSRYV